MEAEQYTLKNGDNVKIVYDECTNTATAYDMSDNKIGAFIFSEIEHEIGYGYTGYYLKITNMDLAVTGQGLGRLIIQHVKDCTGYAITAGHDDGIKCSDGSHLTGGGVGFIEKIREEGLVN